MDYQKMVEIDEHALDVAWKQQPKLMFDVATSLAEARYDFDKAKESYDILVAETDAAIRAESDKKPTEKAIESAILLDADVQDAKEKLLEAKRHVGLIEAAKAGIEHRRAACENMVKLFLAQYFVEPAGDIETQGILDAQRVEGVKNRVNLNKNKNTAAMSRSKKGE